MSSPVFILSGCRTAIGKYDIFLSEISHEILGSFQGQFDKLPASDLGSIVITAALKRATINPQDVDQVIMGQVLFFFYFLQSVHTFL